MISQFELAGPAPVAPLQSVPAAETARIVAVASDDKQNFRTLGMMSSLTAARLIGATKVLHSPSRPGNVSLLAELLVWRRNHQKG
jgi:hypothetical protein